MNRLSSGLAWIRPISCLLSERMLVADASVLPLGFCPLRPRTQGCSSTSGSQDLRQLLSRTDGGLFRCLPTSHMPCPLDQSLSVSSFSYPSRALYLSRGSLPASSVRFQTLEPQPCTSALGRGVAHREIHR